MKNTVLLFTFLLISAFQLNAQREQAIIETDSLSEVVVTSNRIDLPFKENSRTINIITATVLYLETDIKN